MNNEYQTQLTEAHAMLAEAKKQNGSGQHGAALKQAYHASEHVAAAYLSKTINQALPLNDATYDLFAKTIREPNRHPDYSKKIGEVVGKVCALREIYEPALLDETSHQDAKQMIECVEALLDFVQSKQV